MSIESDADRLSLLADFGEDGIYGGTETLRGLRDIVPGDGLGMTTQRLTFMCLASAAEAAGVADGGTLVLAATDVAPAGTFTVHPEEPDGTGWVTLNLESH